MSYYDKYLQFSDIKFRRMLGVSKKQFSLLLTMLEEYKEKHWSKRGAPSSFILADRLLLTLRYLRDYCTFIVVGNEFGISESHAHRIFTKVSESLADMLALPNFKALTQELKNTELVLHKVIIDVSEQPTERPKKTKNKVFR